jgi:hypothetical protein
MAEISPAAQAVLDAFLRAPCDNKLSVAAALRAAAEQVDWNWEPCEQLLTIANELDPTP